MIQLISCLKRGKEFERWGLWPHKQLRRKESWRNLTSFPVPELLISCTNEKRLGAELCPHLWTCVYSSSHQDAHNHWAAQSFHSLMWSQTPGTALVTQQILKINSITPFWLLSVWPVAKLTFHKKLVLLRGIHLTIMYWMLPMWEFA